MSNFLIAALVSSLVLYSVTPRRDCVVRLAGTSAPVETETRPARDLDLFVPTGLTCPVQPGLGTLIFTIQNARGEVYASTFAFAEHRAVSLKVDHQAGDESPQTIIDLERERLRNLGDMIKFDERAGVIEGINARVCEGEAAFREKYLESLARNARELRPD